MSQSSVPGPALDSFLLGALEHDVLTVMLAPPRVPAFATETQSPPARDRSQKTPEEFFAYGRVARVPGECWVWGGSIDRHGYGGVS